MKKLIVVLLLAFSFLANLSAQNVYEMKKKDIITIINGNDTIFVPIVLFEQYGSKCLESYYTGSLELDKKNNYFFSKWGFYVEVFEQKQLLVRNDKMIEEQFIVNLVFSGLSLSLLFYLYIFITGFLFIRNKESNIYFFLFFLGLIFIGFFLFFSLYTAFLLYIGLFVVGGLFGYLSKKIKIN